MITFITGTPGAGKSLNTIKQVCEEWKDTDRPIYYRGIAELKLPWTQLEDTQVQNWFDLPDGSIIVIDEAQQIWGRRSPSKPMPIGVARLDTHRHRGFDFYIITQKPTLVDHDVRSFGDRHFHYERQSGLQSTRLLQWEKVINDPAEDYHNRQLAQTTRVKFDKKYYGLYKSAEIHTAKRRLPKKVYYILGLMGLAVLTMAYGVHRVTNVDSRIEDREIATYTSEETSMFSSPVENLEQMTLEQYQASRVPRVADFPHTAPMYDHLTEAKTFPRPQCMFHVGSGSCACYTQQATPMDVSEETCLSIVYNGWFDATVDEEEQSRLARERALAARAATQEQINRRENQKPRIVIIGQNTQSNQQQRKNYNF